MIPFGAVAAAMTMLGLVVTAQSETALVRIADYATEVSAPAPSPTTAVLLPAAPTAPALPPTAPAQPALPPTATISPAVGAPGTPLPRMVGDKLVVMRGPSVDVPTIERVLRQYNSPAQAEAQTIYDLGVRYGIDPAVCLAFFIVESSAGTRGMATETRSLGNIRATPGYINYKGYRKYATWRDGIEDWYRLISRLYVGEWGLTTVEAIVPVYAPAADSNDPPRYIGTVRRLVYTWTGA